MKKIALLAILILAGCVAMATKPGIEATSPDIDPWIGRNITELITEKGKPNMTINKENGEKIISYTSIKTVKVFERGTPKDTYVPLFVPGHNGHVGTVYKNKLRSYRTVPEYRDTTHVKLYYADKTGTIYKTFTKDY